MRDFSKRIPELDGIRGTAILIVLVFHWIYKDGIPILPNKLQGLLSYGWSGVDLFFVLSGFLIGGILLDSRDSTNYFKVFYARRFYRILPLYGALCLWSLAVFYAHLSTHAWLFQGKIPWYAYLTFGQNFWMAKIHAGFSYQTDVTWSLAIEEQFYLTLPFVIRVVRRKSLPYVLGTGALLAPLIRVALWFALDPRNRENAMYFPTPCRLDGLLLGVLAAYAVRSPAYWDWLVAHKGIIGTTSVILGVGILEMIHKRVEHSFPFTPLCFTWIALFYLSLLLLAVTQRGFVSRLFRFRPLTELGILAYGLYLFHEPVLGLVYGLAGYASPKLTGLSTIGLTLLSGLLVFALTRFSWLYFEKPLLRRGHRYQYHYGHDQTELKADEEKAPAGEVSAASTLETPGVPVVDALRGGFAASRASGETFAMPNGPESGLKSEAGLPRERGPKHYH
jgi:peptidoglycan/LPS O-acetylase OafA/YrhL